MLPMLGPGVGLYIALPAPEHDKDREARLTVTRRKSTGKPWYSGSRCEARCPSAWSHFKRPLAAEFKIV